MTKTHWVTLIAVLIGGLGVGAALVGRPTTPANDVRITSVPPTTNPASTTVAPAPTTTAPEQPSTTTSTVTTVAPVSTTTVTTTTLTVASTTAISATSTTTPGPDRNVTVLVVNAANTSGIARAESDRLAALGYPKPLTDDSIELLAKTTAYAHVGYEDAARLVLADAGLPADRLLPFPRKPITTHDDAANVILVLGLDWQP